MNNYTEAWAAFLVVGSILILFGYFMQATAAFSHAYKTRIILKTFSPKRFIETWLIVATIFFGPLIISWVSNVVEYKSTQLPDITMSLVLSMVMIFITLEFAQIGSLNRNNSSWKLLLLIALFLDIATVVIVTTAKVTIFKDLPFIYALGIFSFFSSFMIIIFAKIAGGDHE